MINKTKLTLIKSKPTDEYEKTLKYNLNLDGEFLLTCKTEKEAEELCQIGKNLIGHPAFKKAIQMAIFNVLAQRLEAEKALLDKE